MHRGHCGVGKRLFDLYQQHSLDLVIADAEKRLAISAAERSEWLALARGVERLKDEHHQTRCQYIEHVVTCKICEWDQLADSYLDAMEHPALKPESNLTH
jgi:hypothetical protein